jgi:hypothetical protein
MDPVKSILGARIGHTADLSVRTHDQPLDDADGPARDSLMPPCHSAPATRVEEHCCFMAVSPRPRSTRTQEEPLVNINNDDLAEREERRERWAREGINITPDTKIYTGEEAARRGRALVESAVDPEELAEPDRRITAKDE